MLIFSVRETQSGYFVDCKDSDDHMIGTYLITKALGNFRCSCEAFNKHPDQHTHFHIMIVRKWLKDGKSPTARYIKGSDKKIQVLVD